MSIKTLALSVVAFAACATAHANVVINNVTMNGPAFASAGSSIGQSFITGTTGLQVTDVLFPQVYGTQANQQTGYSPSETFVLYGNNPLDNSPLTTTALGTFTLDSVLTQGAGFGLTTALANGAMFLAPSTRYWLVLSLSGTTQWSAANPDGYTQNTDLGVTLATDNHTAYKTVGGTTTYFSFAQGPQLLYVEANAVPEPSAICLLAVAGLALVVRRKRSSKVA